MPTGNGIRNTKINRMSKGKVLLLFFVGSESFFFLALIISYVYLSRPGGDLSSTAQYLEIVKTGIFSFFLFSSSYTVEMAHKNLRKGKRNTMLIWLGLTILFGLTFLIGQGFEYAGLIREHVTISQNVFGSSFFTLTGFHGFHVFLGLITLSIIAGLIYFKKYEAVENEAFESVTVYWHFVDAVWVVVFSVVYIGSVI